MNVTEKRLKRFLENVTIPTDKINGCWEYNGWQNHSGHIMISMNNKKISVHRFSYIYHFGHILDGKCVCHKCDNPKCVNPNHLFPESQLGNIKDRVEKGRSASGEDNGAAIYTNEQIREIFNRIKSGEFSTMEEAAKGCNVSRRLIENIMNGRHWLNVIGIDMRQIKKLRDQIFGISKGPGKLKESEVQHIRKLDKQGATTSTIQQIYPLSNCAIRNIIRRKTYKHIK